MESPGCKQKNASLQKEMYGKKAVSSLKSYDVGRRITHFQCDFVRRGGDQYLCMKLEVFV